MNLFEGIQSAAYGVVSALMGYDATWTPSNGSAPGGLICRVLFKDPTSAQKIAGVEYEYPDITMEYQIDSGFDTLKALVDNNTSEVVTINTVAYNVRQVKGKADGKTFVAILDLH